MEYLGEWIMEDDKYWKCYDNFVLRVVMEI
jgi:hypothetical protein